MKTLHLTLDATLANAGHLQLEHELFTFPGGETSIKLAPIQGKCDVLIVQRIRDANDLMAVLLANDALRQGKFREYVNEIRLFIPYLPYARQDRVCDNGEAASLEVFCKQINDCDFKEVTVFDCHSDVGPALLNNCTNMNNHGFVYNAVQDLLTTFEPGQDKYIDIVAPDAGAVKKIHGVTQMLGEAFPDVEFRLITCAKVRDLKTGEILETVVNNTQYVHRHALIIDDICDGGRTMIEVSNVLRAKGADNVSMAVSHGIFSKGFVVFGGRFHRIYTTPSFKTIEFNQQGDEYEFDTNAIKILPML
jgi:ribose-phosphate pyrophosphokinase